MDNGFSNDEKDRLEKFECVLRELLKEYNAIFIEMEQLRGGKEKTARYKELMGRKLMYSGMIAIFEKHGLI